MQRNLRSVRTCRDGLGYIGTDGACHNWDDTLYDPNMGKLQRKLRSVGATNTCRDGLGYIGTDGACHNWDVTLYDPNMGGGIKVQWSSTGKKVQVTQKGKDGKMHKVQRTTYKNPSKPGEVRIARTGADGKRQYIKFKAVIAVDKPKKKTPNAKK
jgi:hypothetical protein